MSAQLKSAAQVRRIYGLAKEKGLDNDELHALVEEATRKTSIARLNVTEADAVIARLGGEPLAARRTVQYRRRRAGVPQIAQASHLKLMHGLARHRGIGDEGLAALAERMNVPYPPRTTADTNKLVEALKAMNRRDEAA